MRDALGFGRTASKYLVCLPEVAIRVDVADARMDLYQHRNHSTQVLRHDERTAIAEDFVVELEQPPAREVGRMSPVVVRQCRQQLRGGQQVVVPFLQKQKMRQLVT